MNYQAIYDSLIQRARTRLLEGYSESHHVVPKCMGGTDDPTNLVDLTPEEHFLAHQLLVKIHPDNAKLVWAANFMIVDKDGRRVNNKLFGWLKRRRVHSEETRKKMSEAAKGRKLDDETKLKISAANLGKTRSEETKAKIKEVRKLQTFSEETRRKMSEARTGTTRSEEAIRKTAEANRGRKRSEETRRKISEAARRRYQQPNKD